MSLSAKELALFYGAKCLITYQSDESQYYTESYWEETIVTIDGDILNSVDEGHMKVKPILYPSNIAKEYRSFGEFLEAHDFNPPTFQIMLEDKYDIFGWIRDDKAISALELEPNPYEGQKKYHNSLDTHYSKSYINYRTMKGNRNNN